MENYIRYKKSQKLEEQEINKNKCYVALMDKDLNIYFTSEISEVPQLKRKGFYFWPVSHLWVVDEETLTITKHVNNPKEDYIIYTYGEPTVVFKRKRKIIERMKSLYESFLREAF